MAVNADGSNLNMLSTKTNDFSRGVQLGGGEVIDWLPLRQTDVSDHSGFMPAAVDAELNVAYGFKKTDGRETLYSIALDGSLHEKLIYARPDVDLDGLITLGRRNRVIGVSYTTDSSIAEYFDPEIRRLATSLSKALPHQPILVSGYIGQGPHVRAGSPIYHADKIKVPVLLFHGALDRNVSISQSQHMASKLSHSNAKVQLVTRDDLDHQLDDSAARTAMLRKIDAFLRASRSAYERRSLMYSTRRKRNADQSSSIATMRTLSNPAFFNTSQPRSRLKSQV